jgi:hypothetical protein
VTLDGPLPPEVQHRYVIGLDIGLKHDRTALAVCHAEYPPGPRSALPRLPRIVLDRLHVLTGTPVRPVQLADVEALAYQAATDYRAPIRMDPWQAVGLGQRLRGRGVAVTEWNFTERSVGRLAMTLHQLFREHRLALPDDAELLEELTTVRLRESTPGVYRLDHDASGHDDRAVAIGLAALALTERAEGRGSITVPGSSRAAGRIGERTTTGARPTLPSRYALQAAAEKMPSSLPGGAILLPGSANDPERVLRRRRGK